MKKVFIVALILMLIGMAFVIRKSFAVDATEAINPEAEPVIMYGKTVSGISKIAGGPSYVIAETGTGMRYNGTCNIHGIQVYGLSTGDIAVVEDRNTLGTTNGIKFEAAISANTSSEYIDAKGTAFTYGIYVTTTDSDVFVSITYDY